MWLDANMIKQADGTNVTNWYDLSGYASHVTQATSSMQPVFKTGIINGLPIVRFDGVDDYLTTSNSSVLAMLNNVSGATAIAVGKWVQRATQQALVCVMRGNTTAPRFQLNVAGGSYLYALSGTRADADTNAASYTTKTSGTNAIYTVAWNYSSATVSQWVNGVINVNGASFGTSGSTSNTNSSAINIGAYTTPQTTFAQGDFGEVLIYNRVLTSAELTFIHNYLSKKWGIALV